MSYLQIVMDDHLEIDVMPMEGKSLQMVQDGDTWTITQIPTPSQPQPDPDPVPDPKPDPKLVIPEGLGPTFGKLFNWKNRAKMKQETAVFAQAGVRVGRVNFNGELKQSDIDEYKALTESGIENVFVAFFPEDRGKRDLTPADDERRLEQYLLGIRRYKELGGIVGTQFLNEPWLRSEEFDARTPAGNERLNTNVLKAAEVHKREFPDIPFGHPSIVSTHYFHESHSSGNWNKVEIWPEVIEACDIICIQPYGHPDCVAADVLRYFDWIVDYHKLPLDKIVVTETGFTTYHGQAGSQGRVKGRTPQDKARELDILIRGLRDRIGNNMILVYSSCEGMLEDDGWTRRGYGLVECQFPNGSVRPLQPEFDAFAKLV